MNLFSFIKTQSEKIILLIGKEAGIEIDRQKLLALTFELCKVKMHGDIALNLAMVFAKDFGLAPQILAQKIIVELKNDLEGINKIEVAGAGFINISFDSKIWQKLLAEILREGEYKLPNLGKGEKVNIDYAHPNPTGPMHVGHTRGAIYGDVLANLLTKTGYEITREYYINDAGNQINTLVKSAYLRYLEAFGEKIEIPEGLYPGEYLKPVGEKLKSIYGEKLKHKDEAEYIPQIRDFVVDEMMKIITADLELLGIKHDVLFSEKKELVDSGKVDEALEILKQKGLIYQGVLPLPKGKIPDDYETCEQTLFKSTLFGDDIDRVVKKGDGSPTYLAGDIAYSLNKFERGFNKMILSLGFDHAGYVKRLEASVAAITDGKAKVKVILCQLVKLIKNGEPYKMSKRAGNFVTARDLIDEVGADVIRFMMLTRKNDAPFDFDLDKAVEQGKDNPIFYVQYAYARCSSVLRNLTGQKPELAAIISNKIIDEKTLANLQDEAEIELIKKLVFYPKIIEIAATNFEPHKIAFYLQELAALFHNLWNKGMENPQLKFIISDNDDLTLARIYLLIATQKIIANALGIFNIKPLEEMR